MELGLWGSLILLSLLFLGLAVDAGARSIQRSMMLKRRNASIQAADDLHSTTNAMFVKVSLLQSQCKLTTSPRLDMTKHGMNSSTDFIVNGRICKCFVLPATKSKPLVKRKRNNAN